MACGTGLCAACLLPVIGADGVSRSVRFLYGRAGVRRGAGALGGDGEGGLMDPREIDLTAPLGHRTLPNPLDHRLGLRRYGRELASSCRWTRWARSPPRRSCGSRAPAGPAADGPDALGMLNGVGLQGVGVAHLVRTELPGWPSAAPGWWSRSRGSA
ncbi:hypothetical protein [Kitasatospora albolonga]|uniref:hypothetical protein n=1 Tax=Kitasatospora albolonga TaxID=68173 RepID=UPI0031EBC735